MDTDLASSKMFSEQKKEKQIEMKWTEVKKGAHVHPRTRRRSWRKGGKATKSIGKRKPQASDRAKPKGSRHGGKEAGD